MLSPEGIWIFGCTGLHFDFDFDFELNGYDGFGYSRREVFGGIGGWIVREGSYIGSVEGANRCEEEEEEGNIVESEGSYSSDGVE